MRADCRSRLYRVLLRLLPRDFRARQGEAMEQAFVTLRTQARARGRLRVVGLHVSEAWDLLRTGAAMRRRNRQASITTDYGMSSASSPRAASLFLDELRMALRSATRHRAFFAFAAVTFALGVGATTAVFSALKSVVLEPLPFPKPDRLVLVFRTVQNNALVTPEPEQIDSLRGLSAVFEDIATFGGSSVFMTGAGDPVRVNVVQMGATLASFLGIRPVLGRTFTPDEQAGEGAHVALLSWELWKGQFGGTPDVTGRTLDLNGEPWTIIGVMPPGLVRPNGAAGRVDLWLPLPSNAKFVLPIARLRPGVSLAAATQAVDALIRRIDRESQLGGKVTPATALRSGGLHDPLSILMAAVTLLLLIACVNVSNLLLHRAAARQRESAVLAALGATRSRLLRQSLLESLLLALAGGSLGVLLALAAIRAAATLRPARLEALQSVHLDGLVLAFSLLVSVVAGLLFGMLPALRAARSDAAATLARAPREGIAASARFRWTLVGVEVALSFALLVGASLLIRSLVELSSRDPGYQPQGLIDLSVTLPTWRYTQEPARREAFARLADGVRRIPGVQLVSLSTGAPPNAGIYFANLHLEGRPPATQSTMLYGMNIDPDYLAVIGQPLRAGRGFTRDEMTGKGNSVILGETAAKQLFPDGSALGQRFGFGSTDMYTVVGIVGDAALNGLSEGPAAIAYWPMTEVYAATHVLVRSNLDAAKLGSALRDAVRAVEPAALIQVNRGTELLGFSLTLQRFTTTLLTAFAALALLLSAIGLYSVLSQLVTGRTHEIGVRVSLGANAGRIRLMVLRSGLGAIAGGLLAGGLMAAAGIRIAGSHMFGLTQLRPSAWLAAGVVLGVVALLAMWWPAERAARTDPILAMRAE